MRIGAWVIVMGLWAGCTTTAGDFSTMTRPEVDASRPSANVVEGADTDGFELDSYKDEQAAADRTAEDAEDPEDLAAELGAEGVEVPEDPTVDRPPAGPPLAPPGYPPATGQPVPPAGMAVPPAPRWTPTNPVTLSWGLRLVSTVDGATPPRAILGLPDGSEEVVKAGDLLPEVGVVVLAVGQDVVQLGRVTPSGDHAQVESVFLSAMFTEPRAPAGAP